MKKRNDRSGSALICHEPRKPWRLVFNWDSGRLFELPWWQTDAQEFRKKGLRALQEIGVDAVTLGLLVTDMLYHDSEFGEYFGKHIDVFYHVNHWEGHERVRLMVERGRYQMTVLVEEAHKVDMDVLASFRMNDTHDSYFSPETPLAGLPPAKFKLDHPELMIRDDQCWGPYCLDFALSEVRDRRFNLIQETVDRFDVDGVELDFMRNGFFFAKGTERENAPLMTKLIRRVRAMLDKYEAQRDKHLHFVVHTPVTQEVALNCGLDVVSWIKAGLVDHVIADEGCVPFSVTPDDFTGAARSTGRCRVYSSMDFLGAPERPLEDANCDSPHVPWTEEQLRGWAAFQIAGGVDGLNIFNGHKVGNKPALANVFGKSDCWEKGFPGDKTYVAHNVSFTTNMPKVGYPALTCLPLELVQGKAAQMNLFMTDDLNAAGSAGNLKSITLRVVFRHFTVEDEVTIKLNGRPIMKLGKQASARQHLLKHPDMPLGEELAERLIPLKPEALVRGRNTLEVTLHHRNPKLRPPLVWKNTEVRICYKRNIHDSQYHPSLCGNKET